MYELRKLTPDERSSPLVSLLDIPDPEVDLTAFDQPLAGIEGFWPITPDDFLDTEERAKNGWCMLNNGVGYLAVEQKLPGVSEEMLQWMFAWQGLDPLNYTVLWPAAHHSAAVSDVDRQKIRNPMVSMEHKCQGITVFTVEDSPIGLQDNITIYLSPEKMGLTARKYYAKPFRIIGGSFIRQLRTELNPGKKWVGIVTHAVTPNKTGVRVQTHIWIGCRLLRGAVKRLDKVSLQPTPDFTKMLAQCTAREWTAIAKSLPSAYAMMNGKL